MSKFNFFIAVTVCLFMHSCIKKDTRTEPEPEPVSSAPPVVAFNFQAKVKSDNLVPNTKMYLNASRDSFSITKFNYFISNIKLTRDDGFIYSETESYHLIKHVGGQTSFNMNAVPEGNYTKIEFLIGVDSLRNMKGAQTGDLDTGNDMYWDWDQGYIFFKLEGVYNTQTQPERQIYQIHIGGFSGPLSCLQTCSLTLATPLITENGRQSSVFYNVQIDEIFVKPMYIDFDYYFSHISFQTFKDVSTNYKDMFVVDKIQN